MIALNRDGVGGLRKGDRGVSLGWLHLDLLAPGYCRADRDLNGCGSAVGSGSPVLTAVSFLTIHHLLPSFWVIFLR